MLPGPSLQLFEVLADVGTSAAISHEPGFRCWNLSGRITDDDLIATYEWVLAAPDFDPAVHDLVDLTAVASLQVTATGLSRLVRRMAELSRGVPSRVAIVAPAPSSYGMARMFEMMRTSGAPAVEDIRVFSERSAAADWLRVDSDNSRSDLQS